MKRCVFLLLTVLSCLPSFSQREKNQDIIENYLSKSLDFSDRTELDSASFYLKKAETFILNSEPDSTIIYKNKLAKGTYKMREGDVEEGLNTFLACLRYFKDRQDDANYALTLYQIGICNYYLNRRLMAMDYFKQAGEFGTLLPKRINTKILQNLGSINLEEGMSKKDSSLLYKAIESYKKAINIYIKEKWLDELSQSTSLLAECYTQLNQLEVALTTIDKSIGYAENAKNENYKGFALIKKSSIFAKQEKLEDALLSVNKAIKIYTKTDDKPGLLYAYNQKKVILTGLKRFELASILSDSIYSLTVGIYNQRIADGVTEMEAKYKTAEKEKEIAEQNLKIKNNSFYNLVLIASIVILMIISVGLYKRHQFKQEQLRKEMRLKDELSIIKTQNRLQEQRLEISRDLHDNIGSQLTFIISSINNLKFVGSSISEATKEKLSSISSYTTQTIDQLRDTVWAMNRNEVSLQELLNRLFVYIEKAKKITGKTQFNIERNVNTEITLSSVFGMHLFRIVQEAVNNAIKHANASEISIIANEHNDFIEIKINDNGCGFNLENLNPGNGLSNIEHRISLINGKVLIDSAPKKGTSITLTFHIDSLSVS